MPTHTEKLIIDLPEDGEAIEIRKNGQRVCSVGFRTTAAGNLQTIVYGSGLFPVASAIPVHMQGKPMPVVAIGGDRLPVDVQVSPEPMERPPVHLTSHANIYQGSCGDVWFDGHLIVMPKQAAINSSGMLTIPADPRGAISVGRTRFPAADENLGMIRFWRKDSTGAVREDARMGLTKDGEPFLNNGGNDVPRICWKFGANWAQMNAYDPVNMRTMLLGFDNSGSLRYMGGNNTVSTVAPA